MINETKKALPNENSIGGVITKIIELLPKTQSRIAKLMQKQLKHPWHQLEASISLARYSTQPIPLLKKLLTEVSNSTFLIHPFLIIRKKIYLFSKIASLLPNSLRDQAISKAYKELQTTQPLRISADSLIRTYDTCFENFTLFSEHLTIKEREKLYQIFLEKHLNVPNTLEILVDSPIFSMLLDYSSDEQLQTLANKQFLQKATQNEPSQDKLFAKTIVQMAKRGSPQNALELASQIPNLYNYNGTAISEMARYLDAPLQERAISIVKHTVTGSGKAEALRGLLLSLKNSELVENILDLAVEISDPSHRTRVLEVLRIPLESSNFETKQNIWRKFLYKSLQRSRSELLTDLAAISGLLADLCTKEEIQQIFKATQDVIRWWE